LELDWFHFQIQEFLQALVTAQPAERRLQQHSADFRGFVLRGENDQQIHVLDRCSVETRSYRPGFFCSS